VPPSALSGTLGELVHNADFQAPPSHAPDWGAGHNGCSRRFRWKRRPHLGNCEDESTADLVLVPSPTSSPSSPSPLKRPGQHGVCGKQPFLFVSERKGEGEREKHQ
jgi:hypothetical protein